MVKVPHADEGTNCPLYKEDMSLHCHKCAWWTRVIGKNPQSEEMIDDWRCAVALLPMLLIENAQQSRGTGAAVETMRNVMAEGFSGMAHGVTEAVRIAAGSNDGRLIDARNNRG